MFQRYLRAIHNLLTSALPDGLLRLTSWGVIDQAIISGTNFVVMVSAARALGPTDFGMFALLITVLTLMESSQRALITTPHNVLGASRDPETYPTYTTSVAVAQLAVAALLGLGSLAVGIVFLQINGNVGLMVSAMALAAFGWQLQEFTRRVLYTETRIPAAVICDSATYIGRIAMTAILFATGALTGTTLMLVFGLSWIVGALIGFWSIRASLSLTFEPAVIREHWAFGRWLFASATISHLPRYAVAALLSSVLSVAAFGAYRAFEQLANATNVPLSALSNVLRPRVAREAKHGPQRVWNMIRPVMSYGGTLLLGFAVTYVLLREFLVELVYGTEYVAFTAAVALVALRPFTTLQKSMLIKALQAMKNTRAIFAGTAIGSIAGTILGGALILWLGLPAAGSIVILSSVVSILWFGRTWRRYIADEESWQSKLDQSTSTAKLD